MQALVLHLGKVFCIVWDILAYSHIAIITIIIWAGSLESSGPVVLRSCSVSKVGKKNVTQPHPHQNSNTQSKHGTNVFSEKSCDLQNNYWKLLANVLFNTIPISLEPKETEPGKREQSQSTKGNKPKTVTAVLFGATCPIVVQSDHYQRDFAFIFTSVWTHLGIWPPLIRSVPCVNNYVNHSQQMNSDFNAGHGKNSILLTFWI